MVNHPDKNKCKLWPSARLGLWTDKKVEQKSTTFFYQEEDQIYKSDGWSIPLQAVVRHAPKNISNQPPPLQLFPPSANQLASICPRHSRYTIKSCTTWEISELDDDPLLFDLTSRPFSLVKDSFEVLVCFTQR